MTAFSQSTTTNRPNRRWSIAILLGIGVLVNYLDRVNLSVAHDAVATKFGTSDVLFGYLLSAYSWTYAAMQIPSGSLLDRFGVRRIMLVAVALWAVASGLAAVAASIGVLFAARFLLGIGEAPSFPANAKAIGLWFPHEERGVPTAMFDAAAKLSIGLSTPFLGLILLRFGLRVSFATTAVLSLCYAALFAVVYRDPRHREVPHLEEHPADGSTLGITDFLAYRRVWGATIGSGACNYCFYLLLTWLPFYLQRGLHMTQRNAVLLTAVPWLVASASGFLIGGRLVDVLIKRGHNADLVRRSVLAGGTAFGLFIFAPAHVHQPRVVLICLALALSGIATASPVAWTLPSLLAPARGTGRVGAIINLSGQIAAITAPIITGYISQRTHSFRAAFDVAGVVVFAGLLSYVFLLGHIESIQPVPRPRACA